jgi:iron complex transport system substrate-binding protein
MMRFAVLLIAAALWLNAICVNDMIGKEVCLTSQPKRILITCYGGAAQEVALFAGAAPIVAQPEASRFIEFLVFFPSLVAVPSVGSFNDVNLESVLKLEPDLVFAGVTSDVMNRRIEALGIPVYTLGIGKHNIKSLLEEFISVGTLLGDAHKGEMLKAYWEEKLSWIAARLADVKVRKRVLYTNAAFSSENKAWWGETFISAAGGINVAAEMPVKGEVSAEKLTLWDPDAIVVSTNSKTAAKLQDTLTSARYASLRAVREAQVYAAPVGTFWWDRPSPESILGILWLAQKLYPQQFADFDLEAESRSFYQTFYGYTIDHAQFLRFIKE